MKLQSGRCMVCRCTDRHGCAGGCWWADDHAVLCSRCARNMAVLTLTLIRKGRI